MKPRLLQVTTAPNRSFSVRQELISNINNRWHCHKEVELIHFHRGSGTQFVGDSIRRFKAGDVVLVGANLPHYWYYDQEDTDADALRPGQRPYSTVIHFTEDFWGHQFLALPENTPLKAVLHKARRGIMMSESISQQVARQMDALCQAEGTYQLIALMQCLLTANQCEECTLLSSLGFQYEASEAETERLHMIYQYTLTHFHNKIRLPEIASLVGLAPNSFCRYFKHRTGKSYSQFLLEIRVGHVCKLLIENKLTIKQICFESGFHNFTCFYEKFKSVTNISPLSYKKAHAVL